MEHNKLRATLPRGTEMSELTLEDGLKLLAEKAAKPTTKKKAAKKGAGKESHCQEKSSSQRCGEEKAAGKGLPKESHTVSDSIEPRSPGIAGQPAIG